MADEIVPHVVVSTQAGYDGYKSAVYCASEEEANQVAEEARTARPWEVQTVTPTDQFKADQEKAESGETVTDPAPETPVSDPAPTA